jgi:hypothetical protein
MEDTPAGAVAETLLRYLVTVATGKTDSACAVFEEILAKVEKEPENIEEITKMRDFLEELPGLVAEQQDSIDEIIAIKEQVLNASSASRSCCDYASSARSRAAARGVPVQPHRRLLRQDVRRHHLAREDRAGDFNASSAPRPG